MNPISASPSLFLFASALVRLCVAHQGVRLENDDMKMKDRGACVLSTYISHVVLDTPEHFVKQAIIDAGVHKKIDVFSVSTWNGQVQ